MGVRGLVKDLGANFGSEINSDASAALGIASGRGLGWARWRTLKRRICGSRIKQPIVKLLRTRSRVASIMRTLAQKMRAR